MYSGRSATPRLHPQAPPQRGRFGCCGSFASFRNSRSPSPELLPSTAAQQPVRASRSAKRVEGAQHLPHSPSGTGVWFFCAVSKQSEPLPGITTQHRCTAAGAGIPLRKAGGGCTAPSLIAPPLRGGVGVGQFTGTPPLSYLFLLYTIPDILKSPFSQFFRFNQNLTQIPLQSASISGILYTG